MNVMLRKKGNVAIYCIVLIMAMYSCQKEEIPPVREADHITEARQVFENRNKTNRMTYTGRSFLPDHLLPNRDIDWYSAFSQQRDDTVSVFVPVRFPFSIRLRSEGLQDTRLNDLILLRMTKPGENGQFTTEMLTLIPDQPWLEGSPFSGDIIVEDWFRPISNHYSSHPANETKPVLASSLPKHVGDVQAWSSGCTSYTVCIGEIHMAGLPPQHDIVMSTHPTPQAYSNQSGEYCYTNSHCPPPSSTLGGSSGHIPNSPPPFGGGSGGNGGLSSQGQQDGLKDNRLSEADKKILKEAIKKAWERSCADKALLDIMKRNGNISFVVDPSRPAGGGGLYVANTKELVYTGSFALGHVGLLTHEVFHAYQHQVVYGASFGNYSKGRPGNINIEFEQIVFQDIANRTSGRTAEVGDMFRQDILAGFSDALNDYRNWINTLTNHGATTPNLKAHPNFDVKFSEHLNNFLKYGHEGYTKNAKILNNLKPDALKKLFDGTLNCIN